MGDKRVPQEVMVSHVAQDDRMPWLAMRAFTARQVETYNLRAKVFQLLCHQAAKITIAACDQCCFEHEIPPMKLCASCRQGAQIGKFEKVPLCKDQPGRGVYALLGSTKSLAL
jgi:hypothetical protein